MPSRPSNYINWTDGSPTKVVQPPSAFALQGWIAGQAPPFQYMNYLFYTLDQWVQWLDFFTQNSLAGMFVEAPAPTSTPGVYQLSKTPGLTAGIAGIMVYIGGVLQYDQGGPMFTYNSGLNQITMNTVPDPGMVPIAAYFTANA